MNKLIISTNISCDIDTEELAKEVERIVDVLTTKAIVKEHAKAVAEKVQLDSLVHFCNTGRFLLSSSSSIQDLL